VDFFFYQLSNCKILMVGSTPWSSEQWESGFGDFETQYASDYPYNTDCLTQGSAICRDEFSYLTIDSLKTECVLGYPALHYNAIVNREECGSKRPLLYLWKRLAFQLLWLQRTFKCQSINQSIFIRLSSVHRRLFPFNTGFSRTTTLIYLQWCYSTGQYLFVEL
jgi:hypothetical protein